MLFSKLKNRLSDWYYNILEEIVDYIPDPPLDIESQTRPINSTKNIHDLLKLLNYYGYSTNNGIPINLWNNISQESRLNLCKLSFYPNPKYILTGDGYNGYNEE